MGWHREGVHEAWQKYGDMIVPNLNDEAQVCAHPVRVFFPLCGKAVDMAYLATKPAVEKVVGIDGIRKALDEFAREHPDLEIKETTFQSATHQRLDGNKITLLKGDFFDLDETVTDGRFPVIFDRASLVAIEPTLREPYVATIGRLIQPGGRIFLVVIEKTSGTEADLHGPPFSVPETEVRRLYEPLDWVESVAKIEGDGEEARKQGKDQISVFYLIQAK